MKLHRMTIKHPNRRNNLVQCLLSDEDMTALLDRTYAEDISMAEAVRRDILAGNKKASEDASTEAKAVWR